MRRRNYFRIRYADEKLEKIRSRNGFRQYIPSKPSKCGIKVFALVNPKKGLAT
jgi:hypothetical protein